MGKNPKPRHKIYLVEWFDAHDGPPDWVRINEYKVDETLVQSVGFLVHEDERYITLVTSDDGHSSVGGGIVIPRVNIISKRSLS